MNEPLAYCNFAIILATVCFSYLGFQSAAFEEKYIFRPESILAHKQFYRLLTSGFLHADWRHLLWNLISLFLFGRMIEFMIGVPKFLLIYLGSILGGNLLSLFIHRHHDYRAYGASGGVCGVIFASIFLFPGGSIYLFPFPMAIPAWLYAIIFLLGSFYGMKARRDHIGHDAHLGGAIIGLLITAALFPQNIRHNPWVFLIVFAGSGLLFVYLIMNPLFLPVSSFLSRIGKRKSRYARLPSYKQEERHIDDILEKISKSGFESLTREEKELLHQVSGKYRKRADSKKPESGLAF
jgi:membrane associated rhomboid family serine protease